MDKYWVLPALLAVLVLIGTCAPYDDTDDAAARKRSGMRLYTDHGTGCQYLGGLFSLTPRLSSNGKQVCGGQQ